MLLKYNISGDKKWVFYNNVQRKSQWIDKDDYPQPTPVLELHGRKFLQYAGRDHRRMNHFAFLNSN